MTTLHRLTAADVPDAAELHRRAFPSFFLSELGPVFLREFYRGFLADGAVTVVARDATGRLVGVVVGHVNPSGFFRRLLVKRWSAFAIASLSLVVRRPRVVPRLFRALTYRGQDGEEQPPGALLSSICVEPAMQGTGTGRLVLEAWLRELQSQGETRAYLTTDALDNGSVNAFYVRSGWRLFSSYETPDQRRMNCYVWPADTSGDKSDYSHTKGNEQ
ncbi:GNAT family N-acetyltransferase [Ornithinimicrobium cerasi]|uniref:GNAT family N-acetyltransferase n=1 Tax=Ornithinimicrobium cerasi TaxID=2248773 RepID=UPI000EFEBB62|nr:GNAT family N-acetyltransferase [Ornithinimicrobium cerasi]